MRQTGTVAVVWVMLTLLGLTLAAQETGEGQRRAGEAIPIGPFLFSPAIELTWEDRDNIHFTPDNEVQDIVYLAKAKLLLELPIYDSYVRFSYTPTYRDYESYPFEENWAHFFDVASEFNFSSGLRLATSYRFITANLENREVDPGGELIPGEEQYDKQFVEVIANYWITRRDGLSVRGSLSDLKYDVAEEADFFDYDSYSFGIGWLHQLRDTLVMDLEYRRSEFDANVAETFRDSASDELTLGLRGHLNPVLSTELRFGWRRTDFPASPSDRGFGDFSGFVASGSVSWQTAHGALLKLELVRSDYPSAFRDNGYYTATGASLLYNLQRGRFFGQARVRLQVNDYEVFDPEFQEMRSDDIRTFGIGLGWRLTDLLSLRGTYLFEDRNTWYPLSYEINTFVLGLAVGY